eukprot:scaffold56717_cov33-Tisochrysis_lutea.AAC.1
MCSTTICWFALASFAVASIRISFSYHHQHELSEIVESIGLLRGNWGLEIRVSQKSKTCLQSSKDLKADKVAELRQLTIDDRAGARVRLTTNKRLSVVHSSLRASLILRAMPACSADAVVVATWLTWPRFGLLCSRQPALVIRCP